MPVNSIKIPSKCTCPMEWRIPIRRKDWIKSPRTVQQIQPLSKRINSWFTQQVGKGVGAWVGARWVGGLGYLGGSTPK